MKDLLLYVADADAQAFLNSLLNKPMALDIRQITFDIERHPPNGIPEWSRAVLS